MSSFIQVAEQENEEPMEMPCEEDMGLLLSTLSAQFPGACGLKYRTETRSLRGVRVVDGKLQPPEGGWGNSVYICVFPKGTYVLLSLLNGGHSQLHPVAVAKQSPSKASETHYLHASSVVYDVTCDCEL